MERLNTYNTVPVQSVPAADLAMAKAAQVVAFASPSAVKAWLECAGSHAAADMAIACIGAVLARPLPDDLLLRVAFCQLLSLCACHSLELPCRQHICTGSGEAGPEACVLLGEPRTGWLSGIHSRGSGSLHTSQCCGLVLVGGVSSLLRQPCFGRSTPLLSCSLAIVVKGTNQYAHLASCGSAEM